MFRKISSAAADADADAHSFSSLASPLTRPPRPTPFNSRSLLQMFLKISSAAAANAHSFSSLASPFARPPKPSPLNSRNSTSLLQMFLKFVYAPADAHSFSSPFTLPPKPTPLNSRNLTSLLQMFFKISSAPADAHSFSSPFSLPPKPTPLNSRNSTSPFTFPAGATSSCPDESLYGPTIRRSRRRLQKSLQTNCTSSDVSADAAFRFYLFMVPGGSSSELYLFNLLLRGFAEKERYHDVLSLYGEMNAVGPIPDFVTLKILLKCLCLANRVRDGFLVMGRVLRMGYMPNSETLNSLFAGLIIGDRVDDAVRMYWTLHEICDCFPDLTTGSILRRVLQSAGYLSDDPSDSQPPSVNMARRGRRGIKGDIHAKELNLGIGSGDNVINPNPI